MFLLSIFIEIDVHLHDAGWVELKSRVKQVVMQRTYKMPLTFGSFHVRSATPRTAPSPILMKFGASIKPYEILNFPKFEVPVTSRG